MLAGDFSIWNIYLKFVELTINGIRLNDMENLNNEILISVIMPVYNAEAFLEYSIGSVISQTYENFELICFNDASTDNSSKILHQFSETDKRIKVIDSPINVKQGGGRNRALTHAKGEYVIFLDADDALAENALKQCVNTINVSNVDAVFFDYAQFSSNGIQQTISPLGSDSANLTSELLKRRIVMFPTPIWTAIYRRSLITDNNLYFPEGVFYEDNAVALAIQLSADKAVKINQPLYHYRIDNNSVTRSTDNYHFFDRISSAETLLNHLRRLGIHEKYPDEINYLIINQYLVHTIYGAIYRFTNVEKDRIKQVRNGIKQLIPNWYQNPYWKNRPLAQKIKFTTHATMPRLIKLISNLNRHIQRLG